MKRFFSLFWRFVLCNLIIHAMCLAVDLCLSKPIVLLGGSYEYARLLYGVVSLAGTVPVLYWVFFRYRKLFRFGCADARDQGISPAENAKEHLKAMALPALAVLLLAVVAVTLMPARYANEHSGGDTGITVLVASSQFFTYYLPEALFGSDTALTRLPGALVWGVFVAVAYILLCRTSCRRFMAEGYTPRRVRVSALLIGGGLFFGVMFVLHVILALIASVRDLGENEGWFTMLTSLLHLVACMILYLAEAIVAVARQRRLFPVIRLACLVLGSFIMINTLFYGTVQTVIGLACWAGLTALEVIALIRGDRAPATANGAPVGSMDMAEGGESAEETEAEGSLKR